MKIRWVPVSEAEQELRKRSLRGNPSVTAARQMVEALRERAGQAVELTLASPQEAKLKQIQMTLHAHRLGIWQHMAVARRKNRIIAWYEPDRVVDHPVRRGAGPEGEE